MQESYLAGSQGLLDIDDATLFPQYHFVALQVPFQRCILPRHPLYHYSQLTGDAR